MTVIFRPEEATSQVHAPLDQIVEDANWVESEATITNLSENMAASA
ncbi:hypothetical protein [Prosthecomicrobium sp. N25]